MQRDRVYRNEFRTLPDPQAPLPDRSPSSSSATSASGSASRRPAKRRQRGGAGARARGGQRRRPPDPHHRRQHLRLEDASCCGPGDSGDEDDDWFFTYFQPYRYVLNRIPVFPSIGNHDTRRDRGARRPRTGDGQHVPARAARRRRGGGPRVGEPGSVLPLPRRRGHRVRLHRHVEGGLLPRGPAVRVPEALGVPRAGVSAPGGRRRPWRIPFGHHPPYCAGPQHHNTDGWSS